MSYYLSKLMARPQCQLFHHSVKPPTLPLATFHLPLCFSASPQLLPTALYTCQYFILSAASSIDPPVSLCLLPLLVHQSIYPSNAHDFAHASSVYQPLSPAANSTSSHPTLSWARFFPTLITKSFSFLRTYSQSPSSVNWCLYFTTSSPSDILSIHRSCFTYLPMSPSIHQLLQTCINLFLSSNSSPASPSIFLQTCHSFTKISNFSVHSLLSH